MKTIVKGATKIQLTAFSIVTTINTRDLASRKTAS